MGGVTREVMVRVAGTYPSLEGFTNEMFADGTGKIKNLEKSTDNLEEVSPQKLEKVNGEDGEDLFLNTKNFETPQQKKEKVLKQEDIFFPTILEGEETKTPVGSKKEEEAKSPSAKSLFNSSFYDIPRHFSDGEGEQNPKVVRGEGEILSRTTNPNAKTKNNTVLIDINLKHRKFTKSEASVLNSLMRDFSFLSPEEKINYYRKYIKDFGPMMLHEDYYVLILKFLELGDPYVKVMIDVMGNIFAEIVKLQTAVLMVKKFFRFFIEKKKEEFITEVYEMIMEFTKKGGAFVVDLFLFLYAEFYKNKQMRFELEKYLLNKKLFELLNTEVGFKLLKKIIASESKGVIRKIMRKIKKNFLKFCKHYYSYNVLDCIMNVTRPSENVSDLIFENLRVILKEDDKNTRYVLNLLGMIPPKKFEKNFFLICEGVSIAEIINNEFLFKTFLEKVSTTKKRFLFTKVFEFFEENGNNIFCSKFGQLILVKLVMENCEFMDFEKLVDVLFHTPVLTLKDERLFFTLIKNISIGCKEVSVKRVVLDKIFKGGLDWLKDFFFSTEDGCLIILKNYEILSRKEKKFLIQNFFIKISKNYHGSIFLVRTIEERGLLKFDFIVSVVEKNIFRNLELLFENENFLFFLCKYISYFVKRGKMKKNFLKAFLELVNEKEKDRLKGISNGNSTFFNNFLMMIFNEDVATVEDIRKFYTVMKESHLKNFLKCGNYRNILGLVKRRMGVQQL